MFILIVGKRKRGIQEKAGRQQTISRTTNSQEKSEKIKEEEETKGGCEKTKTKQGEFFRAN